MKKKNLSILILCFSTILVAGCTSTAYFTVKRPAEISMRGMKRIAIGNFTGKNEAHVAKLIAQLQSGMIDSKAFEGVLDRKYMADVVKEHGLQLTGMFDDKNVAQLGKFIPAAGIIYARIDDDNYSESYTQQMVVTYLTNVDKKDPENASTWTTNISVLSNMIHTRTGTYTLNITYQVVEIETAKLAATRPINLKKVFIKKGKDAPAEALDPEECFATTLSVSCQTFVRLITPSYVSVRADFLLDDELKDVDRSVKNIKAGLMPEGLELLKGMVGLGKKIETQAKSYYNYGLALLFNGQYDQAAEHVRKALSLNPNEKKFVQVMNQVKVEKENARKLKYQEE